MLTTSETHLVEISNLILRLHKYPRSSNGSYIAPSAVTPAHEIYEVHSLQIFLPAQTYENHTTPSQQVTIGCRQELDRLVAWLVDLGYGPEHLKLLNAVK